MNSQDLLKAGFSRQEIRIIILRSFKRLDLILMKSAATLMKNLERMNLIFERSLPISPRKQMSHNTPRKR